MFLLLLAYIYINEFPLAVDRGFYHTKGCGFSAKVMRVQSYKGLLLHEHTNMSMSPGYATPILYARGSSVSLEESLSIPTMPSMTSCPKQLIKRLKSLFSLHRVSLVSRESLFSH